MAGTIMHLVIADRLLDILKINNPAYFYCGNIAPDAIMSSPFYKREMKRHTHFKDDIRLHEFRQPEKQSIYMERLMEFFHDKVEKANKHKEIYVGYLTHMLVDELYILHFRDEFVDRLVNSGKEPTEPAYWDLFTDDVNQVDWELVRSYKFKYKMPEILEIDEDYEIEGYIKSQVLADSKNFIYKKYFDKEHEKETLNLMTFEQNEEFIELCVREIPNILSERFGLNELIRDNM